MTLLDDQTKVNKQIKEAAPASGEFTVGDLAMELIKRFGKDSKIADLNIKDFLQLVLDFNLSERTNHSK